MPSEGYLARLIALDRLRWLFLPQKDLAQCHIPSFIRRAISAPADPGSDAAASAGLGIADLSLTAAERLTHNIEAPPNVDLNAVRFLGRSVMIAGAAISAYDAVNGKTLDERNLARQDLLFTASAVVAPPTAAFVAIPYSIGRVFRDIRESVESAKANDLLDEAAKLNSTCP